MENHQSKLEDLENALSIDEKKAQIKKLEKKLEDESTWKDWEKGQKISQELGELKRDIEDFELLQLLFEDGDLANFEKEYKKLERKIFLNNKHDKDDAIVSIHAGQGGVEAMDWVEMLYRMYIRYAEKKNWKVFMVDKTVGDVAGLKSISFEITGLYSYGLLKKESGVHRLVRQSPFNADSLRQTSFALVEVIPVIDDSVEIEIKDEDLEFEAFRASGSGGQNVNKVSTAVRIKHIPTGIAVECQEERHQGKNRERALKILKAKLYAIELQRIEEKKDKLKGKYKTPGWGNQIRNYVLHPYKLVKDLRTDVESTNPESVLDGDLDNFIDAQLKI